MLSSRWLRSYEVGLANLVDHSIAADVRVADVTDPTCMADLSGRIDTITCNDVIEHVQDTSALLQSIRRLLAPTGLAYFEIPNGRYARAVLSDGHYCLHETMLLDYPEATVYFSDVTPDRTHDTYSYLTRQQYAARFAEAGFSVEWLPVETSGDVESQVAELREGKRIDAVPPKQRERVREAVAQYLKDVEAARKDEDFGVRFGAPLW
jgi:SAM-dependent methyltransferase